MEVKALKTYGQCEFVIKRPDEKGEPIEITLTFNWSKAYSKLDAVREIAKRWAGKKADDNDFYAKQMLVVIAMSVVAGLDLPGEKIIDRSKQVTRFLTEPELIRLAKAFNESPIVSFT